MKKTVLLFGLAVAALLTACSDDDDSNMIEVQTDNIVIVDNITENTTWSADKVYQLGGRIAVEAGATLTIEPGTVIKGEAGTGSNATALVVARGGMIDAVGTAVLPIIFTSVADEISPEQVATGNFVSPNLEPTVNGLWGGVIILGNAPISASNDSDADISEVQIEGIPTSDTNGLYGGSDAADNSGKFQYVSIRHGGTNIGSGNEINGLSLGGVGTGTTISNIEIVSNQDDGIEWFGGSVNVSNVVVWNVGDDGIDTDQAWTGTLDNFVVITPAGHAFELDGPEGTAEGTHNITNGTIIASVDADTKCKDLINTDANSMVNLSNLFFTEVIDQKINSNSVSAAAVTLANIYIDVDAANLADHVDGTVPASVMAGTTETTNEAVLSWTWASQAGKF
ncbi:MULTISPECIES: hypothetical protein [unclassified Saccharicrinis]|uniref:hypothetical protein n=1 Tax=unclassified Saccharicrinis TaxID=2646859 RepID=UPI003D33A962